MITIDKTLLLADGTPPPELLWRVRRRTSLS